MRLPFVWSTSVDRRYSANLRAFLSTTGAWLFFHSRSWNTISARWKIIFKKCFPPRCLYILNSVLHHLKMPGYQWCSKHIPYSLKAHSSGIKKIRDLNNLLTVPVNNITTIDAGRVKEVDDFFKVTEFIFTVSILTISSARCSIFHVNAFRLSIGFRFNGISEH